MSDRKTLLAGEGKNELGGWDAEPAYRQPDAPGALEVLARLARPAGWRVAGGMRWSKIPHYRAGGHRGAEARTVLGLVQWAKERRFDAVVFSRDRDSDKPEGKERERSFLEGLAAAQQMPGAPVLVGEMAIERLESWVLATCGVAKTESLSDSRVDAQLRSHGVSPKDTPAMVSLLRKNGLGSISPDAKSLLSWLEQARQKL